MIRKIVCFVVASAMFAGGLYTTYNTLIVEHMFGRYMLMGVFLAGLGGYWLWIDFLGPMVGRGDDSAL